METQYGVVSLGVIQVTNNLGSGREGDTVVVTLTDNGSGIVESDIPKVFDPFFTTKPAGKGTGLGLSISETIIRDHEGTIAVTNAPRGGAIFRIVLPAAVVS
ncbi:MAG: ATP-binding protein [Betaproteobacteria bacterium]